MAADINKDISRCNSVPELETVCIEHSGSFNHINTSAAITKYAKLRGSSMRSPFFSKLAAVWLQQLPESDTQGRANVLWACSKLGSAQHPVWARTWKAFFDLFANNPSAREHYICTVKPQEISNVLYACAKLRHQPQPDELLLLLEAFAQPAVLAAADPQAIANVIWALGSLNVTPGWHKQVSEELLHSLLAPQLLKVVTTQGVPQAVSNVLVGLSRMCTGPSPLLTTTAAQEYTVQVLSGVRRVSSWNPQDITNAMWALGELRLMDEGFVRAAVAAAPNWLPRSTSYDLSQAISACAQLQYRNEHFVGLLLQRGTRLLHPDMRSKAKGRPLSEQDKARLTASCCLTVVLLDMRGSADAARKLVADSNVMQRSDAHPADLRKLWVLHSWLLQHQLLDGKGLAGLVTEQQLQQGAREAAKWGGQDTSVTMP
jgi:hypothetical protein